MNFPHRNTSFAHQTDEPLFIGAEPPESFAVAAQVPRVRNLNWFVRQSVILAFAHHHSFTAAKLTIAELFSAFLRLAAATGAGRCPFLTSTHNVSNVASGRYVYLRHSVKHYETVVFNVCVIFDFLFLAAKIPIFSKRKRHFWQICERYVPFFSPQKKNRPTSYRRIKRFPYFCPCQDGRNRRGQRKRILRFVP